MANVVRRRADWSDVRLFWAVAELGSFGSAARSLNLGLSTVTRAVDRLESRLNAKLFVRGPQGVLLTEAGSLAYDRALSMERVAEQLEREIADSERRPEGRVKLAAPDGIGGAFLTPFLAEFIRANPKIDLIIDCGFWRDHPLDGDVDLTLTFEEPKHPDSVATPIAHFHYGLFASRKYLDLYGTPETAAESFEHPYVHHVGQAHQRESWDARAAALQDFAHKRIETNSSAVSFAAIQQGAGLGPLPTAILSLDPTLVMLDVPLRASAILWLVYHRDVSRSARIRCVADWLKEVFDPRTKPWYRAEFIHPREFEQLIKSPSAADDLEAGRTSRPGRVRKVG
jgi:DNA-binding transcriptional LysR family regulator